MTAASLPPTTRLTVAGSVTDDECDAAVDPPGLRLRAHERRDCIAVRERPA
jgi:hypothetical protein